MNKKMNRKFVIAFGAVFVVSFMISNATASLISEINEDDLAEDTTFVDPDILLTAEHLEYLYAALLYLGDSDYIELIE